MCVLLTSNYRLNVSIQWIAVLMSILINIFISEPENFLIVADLNTLKLKALDDHLDSKVHILHYGHAGSSYVALVYNDLDKTLFWSDLHEGR